MVEPRQDFGRREEGLGVLLRDSLTEALSGAKHCLPC